MAECVEPVPISDVYADGIAYIENLGNVIRIAYFTWSRAGGGQREKVVVAKVIRPLSSIIGNEELMRMIEAQPVIGLVPERDSKRGH